MSEQRYRTSQLLGLVMDEGPQDLDGIRKRLWPAGTSGRGPRKDQAVPKNLGAIRSRLNRLLDDHKLQREGERYAINADVGRVWVIYVGSQRGYVGVYDASLQPIPMPGPRPLRSVAFTTLEEIGEDWEVGHEKALHDCLRELATIVLRLNGPSRGEAGALVIGLPAAFSLDNRQVRDYGRNDQQPTIDSIVERTWKGLRAAHGDLPDLPRGADGKTLALTADADVVLDTLGAMYGPIASPLDPADPRCARVVLGVKHSVDVRSTVIARGGPDLCVDRQHRRVPGVRRDSVYRGAFGDAGLGHSIALVQRASRLTRELSLAGQSVTWEDSAKYHKGRIEERRPCRCGILDPPHINAVAGYSAVEDRLKGAGVAVDPKKLWSDVYGKIEKASPAGIRARLILEETGRLMAYALDNGIRLYDPEAVLVTGKMVFNDVFWSVVSETVQISGPRCLRRATDIHGDDVNRPIGPRGGAWLGFDTWVFPTVLNEIDASSGPSRNV